MESQTDTDKSKLNMLLARGIAQSRALPKREPEQIWNEFDAVWNEIASQAELKMGDLLSGSTSFT